MSHPFANEMMFGENAITLTGRLAISQAGAKQPPDLTKVMGAFVALTSTDKSRFSTKEHEVWDCEIIIIPKRIYSNGPFKESTLGQAVTELGGDLTQRFRSVKDIK